LKQNELRLIILYIMIWIISMANVIVFVYAASGNAEVRRFRNVEVFELNPANADVIRNRNLQIPNLSPNPSDVIRFRNLQIPSLAPNNADFIRYKNLQLFELAPNNADVIRYRNLQFFQLKPLLYEYKINITSLITMDQNGNPTNNFLKGDIVQFGFTITNLGGAENLPLENGLIAIQIQDPAQTITYLAYTYSDLRRGESKDFIFGYKIPTDAPTGTYTVKVMVFTDWPSEGGLGLDVESKMFVVS